MLKLLKKLNCLGENDPPPLEKMGGSIFPRQFNIFNILNISPATSKLFNAFNISPVVSNFVNNVPTTRDMLKMLKVL